MTMCIIKTITVHASEVRDFVTIGHRSVCPSITQWYRLKLKTIWSCSFTTR